jgi:hypothetical protein
MPKFNVTIEFGLGSTVEPDGINFELDVEEYEDNSYFQSEEVNSSGGDVRFVVEADDEDAAHAAAEEHIFDGMEVTDYNSLTWLVEDVSISVEVIEEPMTLERAQEILGNVAESAGEEVAEAVEYVFAHLAGLSLRVDDLVRSVEAERAQVTRLSESLAAHREASE